MRRVGRNFMGHIERSRANTQSLKNSMVEWPEHGTQPMAWGDHRREQLTSRGENHINCVSRLKRVRVCVHNNCPYVICGLLDFPEIIQTAQSKNNLSFSMVQSTYKPLCKTKGWVPRYSEIRKGKWLHWWNHECSCCACSCWEQRSQDEKYGLYWVKQKMLQSKTQ